MEATEQHEVVEIGFATIGPVFDMVGVAVLDGAAWEATAAIAVVQGASHGGVDAPFLPPDIEHLAVRTMRHDDTARFAPDPPRRFS